MPDHKSFISRGDIKFWVFLGIILAGIIGWGVRLESEVDAINKEREIVAEMEFKRLGTVERKVDLLILSQEAIHISLARIEKDVEYLKNNGF